MRPQPDALGAPIGSGQGLINPFARARCVSACPACRWWWTPVSVRPAGCAQAKELGFDAVLLNSAVSQAVDPGAQRRAPSVWPSKPAARRLRPA
ncbi:MAG: hypothetical protein R3E42_12190 [Burkholderiaceae bacterium]